VSSHHRKITPLNALSIFLVAMTLGAGILLWRQEKQLRDESKMQPIPLSPQMLKEAAVPEAKAEDVEQFCGACHVSPDPGSYPRNAWREQVKNGYVFLADSPLKNKLKPPSEVAVTKYFENRAPAQMPALKIPPADGPSPVRFARTNLPASQLPPGISNVTIVPLLNSAPTIVACDMIHGGVMAMQPQKAKPAWIKLAQLTSPSHIEATDLDEDGLLDLLVADLGVFIPSDETKGRVVWLRQRPKGKFTAITLADRLGRVTDAQAADFDGDGRKDLLIAEFGHRKVGSIFWMRNKTKNWNKPDFSIERIDSRKGAIHLPVCDLNRDGRPDFVTLISQDQEVVVAFINQGKGRFEQKQIFQGAHPALGSSGIELSDLDSDGDLDVIYTAGDNFDPHPLLRRDQGVYWLENRGQFPFRARMLGQLYGAFRAVSGDFDNNGHKDIVAVSFVPQWKFSERVTHRFDAVILLSQVARGQFKRHVLESTNCDYPTVVAGDYDNDGDKDFVLGSMDIDPRPATQRYGAPVISNAVSIWQNQRLSSPRQLVQKDMTDRL
jgi:hypothetical protein